MENDIEEIRNELEGVIEYYHSCYKNLEFEIDESGRPVDPEYYIYKTLKKVEEILEKNKGSL